MNTISVDFERTIGKIQPMHAVGQPPFTGGFCKLDFSPMQVLTDAHTGGKATCKDKAKLVLCKRQCDRKDHTAFCYSHGDPFALAFT